MADLDCIFCDIVSGTSPSYTIWQDENFIAFLSKWPVTEGTTVLIPKQHYTSHYRRVPKEIRSVMMTDAHDSVAEILERVFGDIDRAGFACEGFGVDHLHLKLIPLHGTKDKKPEPSTVNLEHPMYEGYMATNNFKDHDEERQKAKLEATFEKILASQAVKR